MILILTSRCQNKQSSNFLREPQRKHSQQDIAGFSLLKAIQGMVSLEPEGPGETSALVVSGVPENVEWGRKGNKSSARH